MLKFIVKLGIALVGMLCIALLIQQSLDLYMLGETGFASHIEQLGLTILAGIAVGIAFPVAAKRWLFPTILVIAGGLALLHGLILQSQARTLYLVTGWGGSSLGLLIMSGLFKSWTAMYDKHLIAWGGTSDHPTDQDD